MDFEDIRKYFSDLMELYEPARKFNRWKDWLQLEEALTKDIGHNHPMAYLQQYLKENQPIDERYRNLAEYARDHKQREFYVPVEGEMYVTDGMDVTHFQEWQPIEGNDYYDTYGKFEVVADYKETRQLCQRFSKNDLVIFPVNNVFSSNGWKGAYKGGYEAYIEWYNQIVTSKVGEYSNFEIFEVYRRLFEQLTLYVLDVYSIGENSNSKYLFDVYLQRKVERLFHLDEDWADVTIYSAVEFADSKTKCYMKYIQGKYIYYYPLCAKKSLDYSWIGNNAGVEIPVSKIAETFGVTNCDDGVFRILAEDGKLHYSISSECNLAKELITAVQAGEYYARIVLVQCLIEYSNSLEGLVIAVFLNNGTKFEFIETELPCHRFSVSSKPNIFSKVNSYSYIRLMQINMMRSNGDFKYFKTLFKEAYEIGMDINLFLRTVMEVCVRLDKKDVRMYIHSKVLLEKGSYDKWFFFDE